MFRQLFHARGIRGVYNIMRNFSKEISEPVRETSTVLPSFLQGRDLASPETYTTEDLHNLLWSAIDLKDKKSTAKICDGKSVCMISEQPLRMISLANAGVRLGASTSFLKSSAFLDQKADFEIIGKTLGSSSDIVFIDSHKINQQQVQKFANGCTTPVVCSESSQLSLVACLSELMTLYEHYKYLRRLIIAFIGMGSDPMLNAYALILPKLGMHLHFLIDGQMNPGVWEKAVELSAHHQTEFKQFENVADNLYRTHVVSVCPHGIEKWIVSLKDTEEMDLNWTILHGDVHQKSSISRDLLRCKQSLIWDSIANQTWVFQALIASKTGNYRPTCGRPGFEGLP